MNSPTDERLISMLVGIISDGFNRSMMALEEAGAIDRTKMLQQYCGIGSKFYDLVTERMVFTAKHAAPGMRQLFSEETPASRPDTVLEFLDAFEEVFDKDWDYTKQMLGISGQTEDQKRSDAELGLVAMPIIADDGTFVHPRVEDEVEDWGNRARLLAAYRALKKELGALGR